MCSIFPAAETICQKSGQNGRDVSFRRPVRHRTMVFRFRDSSRIHPVSPAGGRMIGQRHRVASRTHHMIARALRAVYPDRPVSSGLEVIKKPRPRCTSPVGGPCAPRGGSVDTAPDVRLALVALLACQGDGGVRFQRAVQFVAADVGVRSVLVRLLLFLYWDAHGQLPRSGPRPSCRWTWRTTISF